MTYLFAFIMTIFFTHVYAAEQLFTQQPAVMPDLALNGEFPVGVTTFEVTNIDAFNIKTFKQQPRNLTLELWYPSQSSHKKPATYRSVTRLHKPYELLGNAYRNTEPVDKGQFPLVIISHGYTGDRTIMFYLAEHLASHGYVVAAIDHTDSTNAEVNFIKSPYSGFPSTLLNRAKDQQFVMDYLTTQNTLFKHIINTNSAAVIGYSMGGYGAINTVGGCYSFNQQSLSILGFPAEQQETMSKLLNYCNGGLPKVDKRWQAMVAFAPWGQELNLHDTKALNNISVPSLFVSGDQDDISGFEQGVKKLFNQTNNNHKYMMVYHNARHNIAQHPTPSIAYEHEGDLGHYFEPAWNNEQITRINEHMVLAFLDCYVKKNQQRCHYLPTRQAATQKKGSNGQLLKPWPGFKSRWVTGVSFYRK